MISKTLTRTLALTACVAAAAFTTAGDDKASVEKQYQRMCHAMLKGDGKTLTAMLAPGFTWVNANGTSMSRAVFVAKEKEYAKMGVKHLEVSMKNDSYDIEGGTARVRSTARIVMSMPQGKTKAKYLVTAESVDTWRQSPKGWMLYKVEVVSETFNPM